IPLAPPPALPRRRYTGTLHRGPAQSRIAGVEPANSTLPDHPVDRELDWLSKKPDRAVEIAGGEMVCHLGRAVPQDAAQPVQVRVWFRRLRSMILVEAQERASAGRDSGSTGGHLLVLDKLISFFPLCLRLCAAGQFMICDLTRFVALDPVHNRFF